MKFFGFGSNTPPPPPPPLRPPSPPATKAIPKIAAPPSIVGRWKEPGGSDTTEFRADGSVMESPASGETIRGRYSLDGAKLKIKLDGLSDELALSAVIKTDALELTDPDGQVTHYRRI